MSAKRVLVVDDDKDVVQMLSNVLRKAGYEVVVAMDALQGVTRALREKPDVILLDIIMPAGGGFTVLQRIKASTHSSMIPIIILTGSIEPEIEERARAFGVHGFFRKPFDLVALMDCIRESVGLAGR